MNDTEKDILIEIMRQNIVEKEKYIYELLRENIKLKAQAAHINQRRGDHEERKEICGSGKL